MTAELISRTGRVQSWLDNPESRLPVSCTVFVVEDSMEGKDGIEASWRFVSHALRHGAGCAVHLSKLRPKGHDNGRGLTASGPVSFAKIYSTLNETLRRGGVYKNGAVVVHLDISHPDILEFVQLPRSEAPWIKRCVDLSPGDWNSTDSKVKDALLYGIKSGDIWLNKIKYDDKARRIFGNVCLEVYLPSRGTCLLQHINFGACEIGNIKEAFVRGMSELCKLHSATGVGSTGEYLPSETDRQVGLGCLGLANLLRRYKVSYEAFGSALAEVNAGQQAHGIPGEIAKQLKLGIESAATVARNHDMVRAFAIAPTASCSYRSQDLDGYTCTPEIAPPIAKSVERDSGTFGVEHFDYGNVEIASEVGWDAYKKVADEIMIMMDSTGLLHGYSFNSWSDVVTYDRQFVEEWLVSPQTSLYYSLQVMGDTQDKTDAYAALDQNDVEDYLQDILGNEPVTCDCQE
ncbi:ribonucleotide reductase [Cyanophage NATL1A-7]|uniref:Ribonucleotide reductase domain-containing protein n=1 Tax=Cyanophage NATL1A-7 TaxID=445693 RepID=E3SN91_9CAUD|nr:ribonucleotide reductase [Cyanophage NATL1A-7]ADP00095.1 ribonucleotide reductase domain-containing protein [Cyanophage NATL1A-7]